MYLPFYIGAVTTSVQVNDEFGQAEKQLDLIDRLIVSISSVRNSTTARLRRDLSQPNHLTKKTRSFLLFDRYLCPLELSHYYFLHGEPGDETRSTQFKMYHLCDIAIIEIGTTLFSIRKFMWKSKTQRKHE